jgi:hypothetical protein
MMEYKIPTSLYSQVICQIGVFNCWLIHDDRISQKSDELAQPDVLAIGKLSLIDHRLDFGMV